MLAMLILSLKKIKSIIIIITDSRFYWIDVNDVANTGVLTHAYDDSEVSFFPPRVLCGCSTDAAKACSNGGNAYVLKLSADRHERGTYCDHMSNENWNFICEANIYLNL